MKPFSLYCLSELPSVTPRVSTVSQAALDDSSKHDNAALQRVSLARLGSCFNHSALSLLGSPTFRPSHRGVECAARVAPAMLALGVGPVHRDDGLGTATDHAA